MNLEEQLKERSAKWNWDQISNYLIKNPAQIEKLVRLTMEGSLQVRKNGSAVLGKICDKRKVLLSPYLNIMGKHLDANPIVGVKRNTLRVFSFCNVPEEIEGFMFDLILKYLADSDETIAVKAFGMSVARKICQKYPELALELIPRIEILVEAETSPGIVGRGLRELEVLKFHLAKGH